MTNTGDAGRNVQPVDEDADCALSGHVGDGGEHVKLCRAGEAVAVVGRLAASARVEETTPHVSGCASEIPPTTLRCPLDVNPPAVVGSSGLSEYASGSLQNLVVSRNSRVDPPDGPTSSRVPTVISRPSDSSTVRSTLMSAHPRE
jgi:hypothetical protein